MVGPVILGKYHVLREFLIGQRSEINCEMRPQKTESVEKRVQARNG